MASIPLPEVDYSPEAVRLRVVQVSRLCERLYAGKRPVDMSAGAVARRLVTVSRLRDLCLQLGRLNP
ncbi:MAG: hypothetical protein ABI333_04865 [bacterium]